MLDHFSIFTRGGLVLWTFQLTALKGNPIEALIQTCLLQERSGETSFQYHGKDSASSYTLKWIFHNELGLVFVAVYQRMLQLLYVDDLLLSVRDAFADGHYDARRCVYPEFGPVFKGLLTSAETRAQELKRPKQVTNFDHTKKGQNIQKSLGASGKAADSKGKKGGQNQRNGVANGDSNDDNVEDESDGDAHSSVTSTANGGTAFDVSKLKNRAKGGKAGLTKKGHAGANGFLDVFGKPKKGGKGGESGDEGATNGSAAAGKSKKQMRKWDGDSGQGYHDFSEQSDVDTDVEVVDAGQMGKSLMDRDDDDDDSWGDDEEGEEIEMEENPANRAGGVAVKAKEAPKQTGWLASVFQNVVGKASLNLSDVEPSLKVLKEKLMSKNVAEEIAEKVCRSVASSLVGRKHASFTRVSAVVREAMEEALTRILTPKCSIDILRDVQAAKDAGRPYVIVFVGVNGVGKSTNLAKVAYWLREHDMKVMLAACDTFRAGAVEQLRTHARRLQVPLFERGYEKDPAVVAREAIKEAQRTRMDAVLVDTAGRMQDNEPLMRALAKLIHMNEPDLVLFVGEALVGNDAVDQLSKFNQRLIDLAPPSAGGSGASKGAAAGSGGATDGAPHAIDGILLTKFDTIDDKVGAALSMVYISGAPVVFVGCGQTYADLRRLNVKHIIRALLQ